MASHSVSPGYTRLKARQILRYIVSALESAGPGVGGGRWLWPSLCTNTVHHDPVSQRASELGGHWHKWARVRKILLRVPLSRVGWGFARRAGCRVKQLQVTRFDLKTKDFIGSLTRYMLANTRLPELFEEPLVPSPSWFRPDLCSVVSRPVQERHRVIVTVLLARQSRRNKRYKC